MSARGWPSAVFMGEPLHALLPSSWLSPLAPQPAREAPADANPRLALHHSSPAPLSAGLGGAWLSVRGARSVASWRERRPRGCGRARGDHVPPLPPVLAAGPAGAASGGARARRMVAGEDGECVCRAVCACVRACAGGCAPGEAVEAAAPWLGAGRGGIARFSPAGAGDLQAIPLYFRRELTSPRRRLGRLL